MAAREAIKTRHIQEPEHKPDRKELRAEVVRIKDALRNWQPPAGRAPEKCAASADMVNR